MSDKSCKRCDWKRKCRRQRALLPEGKTCNDCQRVQWCMMLGNDPDRASSTSCLHCPSTFEGNSHE